MSGQSEKSGGDGGRLVPICGDPAPLFSLLPHASPPFPDAVRASTDLLPFFPGAIAALSPVGISPLPPLSSIWKASKKWPRRRWVALSIVLVVLLVLSGAMGVFFYVNRSTPNKTLDNFCVALEQGNYQTAYQQFSQRMRDVLSEKAFASAFTQDRLTQCTHGTASEFGNEVQTNLMLVYVSKLRNAELVTLAKDEGNVWRIDDVRSGSVGNVAAQASIYHLTLSARQVLRDLTGVFKSGKGGADTGIQVQAGERVVMLATGSADVVSGGQPTGPEGSSHCLAKLMPEPSLACNAVIYSLSLAGRASVVGARTDFMATTDGTIFLGINATGLAQAAGTFQVTIVTIPDGTATGFWQAPDDRFLTQDQNISLAVQVFSQHDVVSRVSFFVQDPQGKETIICTANPDKTGRAVCTWSLVAAGTAITNGPITLGFSISTQRQLVRDPDGVRRGIVRHVRTEATLNWAGYGAENLNQSTPYQSTTISWMVPQVRCALGEDSATSIWAGLMGVPGKSQLAQTGVGTNCEAGVLSYYAWWEMYPALPVQINYQVQPGDAMTASVIYQQGQFQLILDNESEHWYFSTSQAGVDSDAIKSECIVEAPLDVQQQQTLQLSNFGSVTLSCLVNHQPIGVTGSQNIVYQMVGAEQHATTSALDQEGKNFTVLWKSS